MATFDYNSYQNSVSKNQNNTNKNSVKVGFFKLKDDGDSALVRINCSSVNELSFATVHQLGKAQKWMKVSCLNEVGSYDDKCPFCKAVAAGRTDIGKAKKVVYVQMMASYFDADTNTFTEPQPVIWERPAGFSREIATKLQAYGGDLKKVLIKITRNGKAGDQGTTYSLDYAMPTVFKPELVPEDFSAFANFNIAKHSFWEKTEADMNEFITTGSFPEFIKKTEGYSAPAQAKPATSYGTPFKPAPAATPTPAAQPAVETVAPAPVNATVVEPAKPAEEPAKAPVREFTFNW